tara:strand:- start:269 stop:571 length:303 start_codon:yes stop_codon:yes gene_type:complete
MSKKNITIDEVKHIAKLSKLNIPDDELDYYVSEMDQIINYFNLLSEVDTSGIEPMTHVSDIKNVTRDDQSKSSLKASDAIQNCADTFGRFIRIPKILDKD